MRITDSLEVRNGLFYGAVYVAVGMYIAKNPCKNTMKLFIGFMGAMVLLVIESIFFVVICRTEATILWFSVLPASYFLFQLVLNIKINICSSKAILLRKLSTMIYLSHGLFLILIGDRMQYMPFFLTTVLLSIILGLIIIKMSERLPLLKKLF
jgi:serine/alanine racemase